MGTANNFPAECGMDCLRCGACVQKCPQKAIHLLPDGFQTKLYFDEKRCIQCGWCKKVCPVNNKVQRAVPIKAYVAVAKNKNVQRTSASGGAFASVAQDILEHGGVVFGASWTSNWRVYHQRVSTVEQLHILQGSKYARSEPLETFTEAKRDLDAGKTVLYSGTPCQIAGLKSFLGKEYSNLLTSDVICHGTPNSKLFSEYVEYLQKRNKKWHIEEVRFRAHWKDKPGYFGAIRYRKGKKEKTKTWLWQCDPYYYAYMMGMIYQEQCYTCPFACGQRVSDLTFGDPWGLEREMNLKTGNISLILCNTPKGVEAVNLCKRLRMTSAEVPKAIAGNGQLNHPVSKPDLYDSIVHKYLEEGVTVLMDLFKKASPVFSLKAYLAFYTPEEAKEIIHRLKK